MKSTISVLARRVWGTLALSAFVMSPALAETWSKPLSGGAMGTGGARWCVCRNVGTSPHIGQDWQKSGTKTAVALQTGRITNITFSSSCGYFVWLKDKHNTVWRYVHLNRPAVEEGDAVTRGDRIASISTYPKSSCGTGPHLHLERRSAGFFHDDPVSKRCEAGLEACYYNPNKPFTSSRDADLIVAETDTQEASYADYVLPEEVDETPTTCKVDPQTYATDTAPEGKASDELLATVDVFADQSKGVNFLAATAALTKNPLNECAGRECLVDWAVLARTDKGQYERVFYDNAIRDVVVERQAEEGFCAPAQASGDYIVRVSTSTGRTLWLPVTAK